MAATVVGGNTFNYTGYHAVFSAASTKLEEAQRFVRTEEHVKALSTFQDAIEILSFLNKNPIEGSSLLLQVALLAKGDFC